MLYNDSIKLYIIEWAYDRTDRWYSEEEDKLSW